METRDYDFMEDSRVSNKLWFLNDACADVQELSYGLKTLDVMLDDLYSMLLEADEATEAHRIHGLLVLLRKYKEDAESLSESMSGFTKGLFEEAIEKDRATHKSAV